MKQCIFIKPDGNKCQGYAVADDEFCFAHSAKHQLEHDEAVMRGGKSLKRSYVDKEPILLRTNEDAAYLIEKVINEVRMNQISVKAASVLAILINLAMKSIPLAIKDKTVVRSMKMFNKGELDLVKHVEVLDGEVRNKK